jgi:phosphoribosylanthranilate isomerase
MLKIKVCGMKQPDNIRLLSDLPIDMMGFIFYPRSPRYAGNLEPDVLKIIPEKIKKVGVFVNAEKTEILKTAKRYGLNILQLHGTETPELCHSLRDEGYEIIKVFSIANAEDLENCALYENVCNYFLFDTKTAAYGGSGQTFDWSILSEYKGLTPFFLSGGIGIDEINSCNFQLLKSTNPNLYALDLNSRFEIKPGLKNIDLLKRLFQQ